MNEPASGLDQDLDAGYYSADPLDDPEVLRKHFDAGYYSADPLDDPEVLRKHFDAGYYSADPLDDPEVLRKHFDAGYYSVDPLDDPEVLRKHFDALKDAGEDSADSCDDLGGQRSDVNPQSSETVVVDVSPESNVGFTFIQDPFGNTLLGGFVIREFGTLGAVGGAARVDEAGNVTALATGHAVVGIRGGQVGGTLHHGPTETGAGATVGTKGINAGASVMGVGAGVRLGGPGVVSVDVDVKVFSFSLGGKPKLTLLGINIFGD
jgi:hypothetical protein